MRVLGIESTAHTFGVGVVEDGEILVDEREMIRGKEGIVPSEAAGFFTEVAPEVVDRALEQVNGEVDLVAFARGPGLPPCLRVGALVARYLSTALSVPLVGVNHCVAHIEIGKLLTGAQDPLIIYTSGANTQIIALQGDRYRIFGETLDIALGNLLDSFGREAGLPFPAGPELDRLHARGKNYIPLPYTVKGMDLTFSGLLTAAVKALKDHDLEDVVFSLMETAYAMVVEVAERALAYTGKEEILVVGGVGKSPRLREMLEEMAGERGVMVFYTPPRYCADNGVMIAYLGYLMWSSGNRGSTEVDPKFRTDMERVTWVSPSNPRDR